MKKIISIVITLLIVMLTIAPVVNAEPGEINLPADLYIIGSKYGMTENEKVKIQRYLQENQLSDQDCDRILALAKEADQIMIDHNTTDYKSLPSDVKAQLRSLAVQAADIAGVELEFTSDGINIYKDGKLIESITESSVGRLAYTGKNVNSILIISTLAIVALGTIFVVRSKVANA